MFTIFLQKQADIWKDLVEFYRPKRVIDFTYGTGALWWNMKGTECEVVKTDAQPSLQNEGIIQKDLTKDDYADLGKFDAALFDPPYLIGRKSFDYPLNEKRKKRDPIVQQDFRGPRSWSVAGGGGLNGDKLLKFVANPNIEVFNERVRALNDKAHSILNDGGLLFVKIMDPRDKGRLLAHHITITNLLTNFELIDLGVYIRQGASTFISDQHLQNLHGYWMVFKKVPT